MGTRNHHGIHVRSPFGDQPSPGPGHYDHQNGFQAEIRVPIGGTSNGGFVKGESPLKILKSL